MFNFSLTYTFCRRHVQLQALIAYLKAILSTVLYSKTNDSRITGVMDEEYTDVLHRLCVMTNTAFNDYLVRRMSAYIGRWPVDAKPAAAPAPAAAANAAAAGCCGSGEAADGDDWILTMGSYDGTEPAPPASQLASGGRMGAA